MIIRQLHRIHHDFFEVLFCCPIFYTCYNLLRRTFMLHIQALLDIIFLTDAEWGVLVFMQACVAMLCVTDHFCPSNCVLATGLAEPGGDTRPKSITLWSGQWPVLLWQRVLPSRLMVSNLDQTDSLLCFISVHRAPNNGRSRTVWIRLGQWCSDFSERQNNLQG